MRDVFVERRLPQPVTEAEMRAVASVMLDGCLSLHRVSWCGSLLSEDGTEMFCHFRGLDVESVRIAMRQSGAPPGVAWACEVQGAGDLSTVTAVVVHTADTQEQLRPIEASAAGDHGVRLLRGYRSGDGLKLIALYAAPHAEAIRAAQREAGLRPDRVVAVRRYAP